VAARLSHAEIGGQGDRQDQLGQPDAVRTHPDSMSAGAMLGPATRRPPPPEVDHGKVVVLSPR
jgi:hypothetical protein